MKISKWISLLLAVILPMNALAVTEGEVEQAPDVDLTTYTEWMSHGTDAYLPDAAMYADRIMTEAQIHDMVTPQPTITPMPFPESTPMPEDVLPQPTTTPMLSPEPSPIPEDDLTGTDTQDTNWPMVLPTPTPAPGYPEYFDFLLPEGKLFTIGEQERIQHIMAERAKGFVRHPDNSDMVVLMPSDVFQTTLATTDQSEINNKWSVFYTDGSHVQTQQTDAALMVPGDMALCQVNPDDFDGESWYLVLPARELTENELLAVFDAFELINLPFNPNAINIRNCSRGLAYNRALHTEEIERLDRLYQLVRSDLIPSNIDFNNSRNLIIYCVTGERLFLRPYSSMKDEELLLEINIGNQDAKRDAINKMTEREAREMLSKYFCFPLSMERVGYIEYSDFLIVDGIKKDSQQIVLKQASSAIGAEFILSEDAGSFAFIDVCLDYEGRMLFVQYMNIPKVDNNYGTITINCIDTDEKYPTLCTVAEQFAEQYFNKFGLTEWYQATGEKLVQFHSIAPTKPYMTLYTCTDEALFVLTIEEDGTVREADVHFFDHTSDLAQEMTDHPEEYHLWDMLAE